MKSGVLKLQPFTRKIIKTDDQEFSNIVQQMVRSHPKSEISFNQFMQLLAKFDIKFYSPEEFKKMSKIFNNTFHVLPTNTPFEYLQLQSKQTSGPNNYYLVRILHKKVDIFINDAAKMKVIHPVDKCMGDFVVLMRKRYGSETNWFKVLGGMTVAISIEIDIFKSNLIHIMRNTSHSKCIDQILSLFLESHSKIITWQQFMAVIRMYIKKIAEDIRAKSKKSIQHNDPYQKSFTEPKEYFTIKSNFFSSEKIKKEEKTGPQSLRKQSSYSRSAYGTRRWGDGSKIFGSRCRTQGTEELNLKLSMHQCPLHSKTNVSVSLIQGSFTAYPLKKFTETSRPPSNIQTRAYFGRINKI